MILITGAAGKTGRALTSALAQRGQAVRALVRREEQAAELEMLGASECLVGDIRQAATLRQAAEGAQALYHICPNVQPDELAIGQVALRAAQEAGVAHFVYHSVLHPHVEAMPHHWQKMRMEEALFSGGVPFTILQPTAYMQNLLANWQSIVEGGIYAQPYDPASRLSLVDLNDVAQAAATVLTQPGHVGAIYELVGTPGLAQTEVAAVFAAQLGREVRAEVVARDSWEQRARAGGLPDYAVRTLLKMFEYYERYGMAGSPGVLGWLLGYPPATLAEFVRRAAATHA